LLKNRIIDIIRLISRTKALMTDQLKPTTERARKRAAGKILRDLSIRRRETYFDLLVSGYSIEQIAAHTPRRAYRRFVALSARPWRNGVSMRLRTMPASRLRG
jgi:hypothetical protein